VPWRLGGEIPQPHNEKCFHVNFKDRFWRLKMDHVVYLDAAAKDLDLLLSNEKTMIIRGATGRKMPYGRVNPGDVLYFINNNAEGAILACAKVKSVLNSEKLTGAESTQLIEQHQEKLQLTQKQLERWAGKRFLVLVEVGEVEKVQPFRIDKSGFGNMDDWLLVEQIEKVRITL
jgi:hypothetical protein